ncbi:hypothetical protein LTS18_009529, partial [Coniosporium uncinatum]
MEEKDMAPAAPDSSGSQLPQKRTSSSSRDADDDDAARSRPRAAAESRPEGKRFWKFHMRTDDDDENT